ncbi:MAG: TIGR02597 family protein [Verrucomicrobiota bacterium]|nr:TIGR02597 family protein [Verrucomicrobiota bacterium]
MKHPSFLSLLAATSLLSLGSVSAVTFATDPVGFTNLTLPANSDSYISVPFTRPADFVGAIQSVTTNTITVTGSPNWGTNKYVYAAGTQPNHYYALIGSGGSSNPKEGHNFLITGSTTNTVTVDTSVEPLTGITANTQVTIIPYWTLATVFPATDSTVSFTPTTSTSSYKTEISVPNEAANGINLPYLATYFFSNNVDGTSSNVGWRQVGDNTTDHGDDLLLPDSYFVVRNQNGAPTLPLTTLGAVLTKKFTTPLRTQTGSQQDNPVAIIRPLDVTLNMTGLNPNDGSFVPTTSGVAGDQLLLFSNAQIGFSKTPVVYYRDANNNNNWRLVGDNNLLDHGDDAVPVGTGFIVRKAQTGTGANAFWTNSFPVQALSAVSRKVHGNAGTFDIPLPLTDTPAVEPRNPDTGYQIVMTFPVAVTFSGVSVTSGVGSATVTGSGTTQATVTLTGTTNAQFVTVSLLSVNDGTNVNDVPVTIGLLIGDTNQDGTVNSGDSQVTRSRSGQVTQGANFKSDLNSDGFVDSGDAFIARRYSGKTLFNNPSSRREINPPSSSR